MISSTPIRNYPSFNDSPPNSTSPVEQDEPDRGTDITLNPPPEILVPSYLPFLSPHPTAALSEPTEALPGGDYFPTNTMDIDWGSGEYMETISYLGAEGDDLYSLVSNRPSDMYDLEESSATESYDTSFPTRVGLSLSSFHPHLASPSLSPSLTTTLIPGDSPTPIYPPPLSPSSSSSSSSSVQPTFQPTPAVHSNGVLEASEMDWSDAFTIEATALLLPDMNSIEYYTTQLAKEDNTSLNTDAAEHRGNITTISGLVSHAVSISATHLAATRSFSIDPSHMLTALFGDEGPAGNSTWVEEEFLAPYSGYEPLNETGPVNYTVLEGLQPVHMSDHFSVATPPSVVVSSSIWEVEASPTHMAPTATAPADATALLPDDTVLSSLLTDVYWFTTESVPLGGASSIAAVPSVSAAVSPIPATTLSPNDTATLGNAATNDTTAPGNAAPSAPPNVTIQSSSAEPSPNSTWLSQVMIGDEGMSEEPTEGRSTAATTAASASPEADTTSLTTLPDTTTAGATSTHLLTSIPATMHTEAVTTGLSTTVVTVSQSPATTRTTTTMAPARQYLCSIDKPAYAVRVVGYAKSQIRDILKSEFNRMVELQVMQNLFSISMWHRKKNILCSALFMVLAPPPKFVFRVVSGPVVYTAISVTNALRRSGRRFLSVSPSWTLPDNKYRVHSVLQFVPSNMDIRACNFSERIEKGLTMALAEVRHRAQESTNFTVHIVNITKAGPRSQQQPPVNIYFAVRGSRGYLLGSEVTSLLLRLTTVEFSYYMGFPVLEIAEPLFLCPDSLPLPGAQHHTASSFLLVEDRVGDPSFQAKLERLLAQLLGEAMGTVRRAKRATSVGNNSVQIVYFVEGPSGQRMPAAQSASLLNSLDVQRAAIVLGHRVQGVLAQREYLHTIHTTAPQAGHTPVCPNARASQ
ncbi:hypothetical protein CRUP_037250 [Coryphaenoides rupestris]|nr:hypothetical protein CRUP_037250 [Coryphaenoides rupestris]